jgi:AraC-like DNA-binding protein
VKLAVAIPAFDAACSVGAVIEASRAHVADVLERMAELTPQAARPWSRRMLASATGLSRSSVQRILSAHDLVPHPSTCGQ